MTPHEYLRRFRPDRALLTGETFNRGPLQTEGGDRIGVVLLGLGGPSHPDEVVPFLYSRLMDPGEVDLPAPGAFLRRRLAGLLARRKGRDLKRAFEMIGGSSPLRRHAQEQAEALERRLNGRFAEATGASFHTYVAMRHGTPSMAEARQRMADDGVTKVVLLPLQPHFAASTTGSSLSHWASVRGADDLPVTLVTEYATHPMLVRAINERIDEALQRFPRESRGDVQILFAAQGAPRRHLTLFDDPYCCHVEATVRAVLAGRGEPDRRVQVAYRDPLGSGRARGLSVADAIDDLADDGSTALLVVPVSFISDRVETAFDLDVTARARAATLGVSQFEVSSGLNCHPLLIEALAECVGAHVGPLSTAAGDGVATAMPPAEPVLATATPACSVCGRSLGARQWPPAAVDPAAQRSAA